MWKVISWIVLCFGITGLAMIGAVWCDQYESSQESRGVEEQPLITRQTCETCGEQWDVFSRKEPGRAFPSTIRWCHHCGVYCQKGLKMVCAEWESEEAFHRAFLPHAQTCGGCKRAAFTPEEWDSLTGAGR